MSSRKSCLRLKHILPLLAVTAFACSGGGPSSLVDPGTGAGTGGSVIPVTPIQSDNRFSLDIKLEVKPGESPAMPGATLLADPADGTSTDSTNLYIDVSINNAGADNVYLPSQAQTLVLDAQVDFVDIPYKKNFSYGKLKLVIGWTDGGLQASEVQQWQFGTDSTLHFSMPLARVDSFHVADNVAIYGLELADNLFIHASKVVKLSADQGVPGDSPAMVGYVQRIDNDNDRIYVSGATVVIADSTVILDTDSTQIGIGSLQTGANELTITGLAWGYTDFVGMTANGWEFRRFQIMVARPVTQ
jgi:hypothetical protein